MARPRRDPKEGERVGLSLRVTPDRKRRLDAAVDHSGRSQSAEVELRLDRSFWLEDRLDRIESKLDELLRGK